MKNIFYSIKSSLLTIFGDIRVFPFPMFVVYAPKSFKVKGYHTREIMELLQPGDVLMRSYDSYLDGLFIPKGLSGCSHTGIHIGNGVVIHAIAEGITEDDVIDFCRCDRIAVMRPRTGVGFAVRHALRCLGKKIKYDFDFSDGNSTYYCHEFTASCFPTLDIQKISRKAFGFISSPKVYLADSFFCSNDFSVIYK